VRSLRRKLRRLAQAAKSPELKARLAAAQEEQEFSAPAIAEAPEAGPEIEIERPAHRHARTEGPVAPVAPSVPSAPFRAPLRDVTRRDGGSWLGVETQEVTSEKAKSLKLSSEPARLIGKVLPTALPAKRALRKTMSLRKSTDSAWKARPSSAA